MSDERDRWGVVGDPAAPDSMDVRRELLARVHRGELSLEDARRQIIALKAKRKRMVSSGTLKP